jgi:pyruvate ferredoxin oxidoreductase beta subunit
MANLKELSKKREILSSGHRLCAGCAAPIVARQVLSALDDKSDIVIANATGCLEVATTIYPYTAWKVPWIHNAFENASATLSGVETAYRALKKQNKLPVKKDIKFLAFGGDGGTYDIGLQSLSGALERGHNFVYVCYDNQAYMNTGIQRSSATPFGAATKTAPAGVVHQGKEQYKKNLTEIIAAHGIKYIAQANPWKWNDLVEKAKKAFETEGPAFLNIISPCVLGWGYPANKSIEIAKLATETNFWPLFEIENGVYKLNYEPKEKVPIINWLKSQSRFKHILTPQNQNIIKQIQSHVDTEFEKIKSKCNNKM